MRQRSRVWRRATIPHRVEYTSTLLRHLANPVRLQLLRLCAMEGRPETPAELTASIGRSPATVSKYLVDLTVGGLLESRRDGHACRYRATAAGCELLALLAPLLEDVTPAPGPDPPSSA